MTFNEWLWGRMGPLSDPAHARHPMRETGAGDGGVTPAGHYILAMGVGQPRGRTASPPLSRRVARASTRELSADFAMRRIGCGRHARCISPAGGRGPAPPLGAEHWEEGRME